MLFDSLPIEEEEEKQKDTLTQKNILFYYNITSLIRILFNFNVFFRACIIIAFA